MCFHSIYVVPQRGVSLSSIFKELMYNYICLEVLVHNSIGGAQCGHSHIVWVSMSFTVGVPGIVDDEQSLTPFL